MKGSSKSSSDKMCMSSCTPTMMSKFLGVFFLAIGVVMLMNYQAVLQMVVDEGTRARAMAPFLHEYLIMIVGYAWPVVATLVGLSFLTCFHKKWAVLAVYFFMLTFVLGHMWAGNMTLATFALLVALFVSVMKGLGGLHQMCEMKK